jgi:hypothetical protein
LFAWLVLAPAGCKSCHESESEADRAVDEGNDPEEQDDNRDNLWRVRIAIVGAGRVENGVLDCSADGTKQSGACGPELFRFKERKPPLLRASAANGWRFDHWDSLTREPNGSTKRRAGPMPDGPLYLNGFGYADTNELETVTAVFVKVSLSEQHEAL